MSGRFLCLTTMKNRRERLPLRLIRAFVNDGLDRAISFENRARPSVDQRRIEAIQGYFTERLAAS